MGSSNRRSIQKEIREVIVRRKLSLSYTPEAEQELRRLGGDFTQLLNILRESDDFDEFGADSRIEGQLSNGKTIVISARPFNNLNDTTKEARIGLFVWDVSLAGSKAEILPKRSA